MRMQAPCNCNTQHTIALCKRELQEGTGVASAQQDWTVAGSICTHVATRRFPAPLASIACLHTHRCVFMRPMHQPGVLEECDKREEEDRQQKQQQEVSSGSSTGGSTMLVCTALPMHCMSRHQCIVTSHQQQQQEVSNGSGTVPRAPGSRTGTWK
jgi:hypothetical protein